MFETPRQSSPNRARYFLRRSASLTVFFRSREVENKARPASDRVLESRHALITAINCSRSKRSNSFARSVPSSFLSNSTPSSGCACHAERSRSISSIHNLPTSILELREIYQFSSLNREGIFVPTKIYDVLNDLGSVNQRCNEERDRKLLR